MRQVTLTGDDKGRLMFEMAFQGFILGLSEADSAIATSRKAVRIYDKLEEISKPETAMLRGEEKPVYLNERSKEPSRQLVCPDGESVTLELMDDEAEILKRRVEKIPRSGLEERAKLAVIDQLEAEVVTPKPGKPAPVGKSVRGEGDGT